MLTSSREVTPESDGCAFVRVVRDSAKNVSVRRVVASIREPHSDYVKVRSLWIHGTATHIVAEAGLLKHGEEANVTRFIAMLCFCTKKRTNM